MSSFWWHFHHWLHWKLSFWQLPVQLVMKISSKWQHFRFSGDAIRWHRSWSTLAQVPDSTKPLPEIMWTNPWMGLMAFTWCYFQSKYTRYQNNKISLNIIFKLQLHLSGANELAHQGWDKIATIFPTTSSSAFSWMKVYEFWLKFHWSLLLTVQLTIFPHRFR